MRSDFITSPSFMLCLKNRQCIELPKPCVMGIVNASPNSFYHPVTDVSSALKQVECMVHAGVSIVDIGGEATNPKVQIEHDAPSLQEEMDRVLPLIEAVSSRFDVLISVDTSRPGVMFEAVRQGADMLNDQRALRVSGALEMAAALQVPVCLMHAFETPRQPGSSDLKTLLTQIKKELSQLVQRCEAAGIAQDRIIVDPGFGQGNYGKNCDENYYLLSRLHEFTVTDYPVLVGWSRKSMIGDVVQAPPSGRLWGSLSAATIAAMQGASVIRTHDVKETLDALAVYRHMVAVA